MVDEIMNNFVGMKTVALLFSYISLIDAYCHVDLIPVQPDFDIKKYTGLTWYEQKLTPVPNVPVADLFTDYTHVYYLHQDGTTVTYYASGRLPSSPYSCMYYRRELITTNIPGRLKLIVPSSNATHRSYNDYIIVGTDYETYSIVYKCGEKLPNGNCLQSDAWIFSTTPQMSTEKMTFAESIINSTGCIDISTLIELRQTNECQVDKRCAIYTIDKVVKQNFDPKKLAGKWFVTRYLPGRTIAEIGWNRDYQINYSTGKKGPEMQVFSRGRTDNTAETCVYSEGQLLPAADNGKFVYKRIVNNTYHFTDVWMISTDYVTYALWYGCQQTDDTGICTYQTSWVLNRNPVESEHQRALIDVKLQELCLNSSHFVQIDNSNPCPDQVPSKGTIMINGLSMLLILILVVV